MPHRHTMLCFDDIANCIPQDCATLWVAYSGGVDSHVLLHLLASQADLKPRIVAVYVNHNLQMEAAQWGAHCQNQAELLGVAFRTVSVDGRAKSGESPEAAAREARYQALQALMNPGDAVFVGQHREDQMETLLLQLFRGAGIRGLSAMPSNTPFGCGRLLRPLLEIGKNNIEAYARHHSLQWVTDPSNHSRDYDRNFLRHDVIPILKQRWPALDKTIARSARHCAEAAFLLDNWSEAPFNAAFDSDHQTLDCDEITRRSHPEGNELLRRWLVHCTGQAPSEALLQHIRHDVIDARDDATPVIPFGNYHLKRYRNRLYCLPEGAFETLADNVVWPHDQQHLILLNGLMLVRDGTKNGINAMLWQQSHVSVRPRRGGEKLKLPGRAGHHSLKKLFQEAGVPPWQRESRPLIYLNDRLAAVAGLWVDEWAWNTSPQPGYQIRCQAKNAENSYVDGA